MSIISVTICWDPSAPLRNPCLWTYLVIEHDVDFLRVEPALTVCTAISAQSSERVGLLTLITITDDQDLIVVSRKLDVAVPLLEYGVERA